MTRPAASQAAFISLVSRPQRAHAPKTSFSDCQCRQSGAFSLFPFFSTSLIPFVLFLLYLTFIWHLLCGRHCSGNVSKIDLSLSTKHVWVRHYYYLEWREAALLAETLLAYRCKDMNHVRSTGFDFGVLVPYTLPTHPQSSVVAEGHSG